MNTKNITNKKALDRWGAPLMGIIPWCISVCVHVFKHHISAQNTKDKKDFGGLYPWALSQSVYQCVYMYTHTKSIHKIHKTKKTLDRWGAPLIGMIPWCISVCIHYTITM